MQTTSSTAQHAVSRETRRLDRVIDEYRRQAHRTASIPEKVELIIAMSELRRQRTRVVGLHRVRLPEQSV